MTASDETTEATLFDHMVAHVADLDREHARTILVRCLEGTAFVGDAKGVEHELHELHRLELVDYREALETEIPKIAAMSRGWLVTPKLAAWIAGVRLARSVELLCVLTAYGFRERRGHRWTGVGIVDVLRELDLRAGGRGDVSSDPYEWLSTRRHADIVRLARRGGLDPEGVA